MIRAGQHGIVVVGATVGQESSAGAVERLEFDVSSKAAAYVARVRW